MRGQTREPKTHVDDPESERFVAMAMVIPCDEVVMGGPRALPPLVRCGPVEGRQKREGSVETRGDRGCGIWLGDR